jgi:hypothetical protein
MASDRTGPDRTGPDRAAALAAAVAAGMIFPTAPYSRVAAAAAAVGATRPVGMSDRFRGVA